MMIPEAKISRNDILKSFREECFDIPTRQAYAMWNLFFELIGKEIGEGKELKTEAPYMGEFSWRKREPSEVMMHTDLHRSTMYKIKILDCVSCDRFSKRTEKDYGLCGKRKISSLTDCPKNPGALYSKDNPTGRKWVFQTVRKFFIKFKWQYRNLRLQNKLAYMFIPGAKLSKYRPKETEDNFLKLKFFNDK